MAIRPVSNLSTRGSGLRKVTAFTLIEVIIATAIGTIIIAGVMTAFIFLTKSFNAFSNYASMHADGRLATDRLSTDLQSAYDISSFNASNLVLAIPTAFDSKGTVISNKTVSYSTINSAFYRNDSSLGVNELLASNIVQVTFSLFDHAGNTTAVLANAKGVQIDMQLRKSVVGLTESEDYVAARINMRNKP